VRPGRRRAGSHERSPEPEALGNIIQTLRGDGELARGLMLGELGRKWPSVVGERLARESAPVALVDDVLMVAASSSAWAAQIRFLSGEVRDRVNRELGEGRVREVRVSLARDVPAGPEA
jgi:predicted nucleic acid-binding Zn ribbon protein